MAVRRPSRSAPAIVAGEAAAERARVAPVPEDADPSAAAFFDIDNTIVRGASVFHLAMGLAQRDFFSFGDVSEFVWKQVKFRVAGREDLEDISSTVDAALSFVAGHQVEEINRLAEEIFDERIADRLYAGTVALASQHLAAGHRVWLVSAAPIEMATVIADRLGLTGALGTVAEARSGVYTGHLRGAPLHGPAKAEAVRALAARESLDLSRCSAYSDSANDIPMLTLVGHPTAVNPDGALRRHAKAMGWQVYDYRTGRKAVKIGVPTALAVGVAAGVIGGVLVDQRRRNTAA
ncbi:MAG: HAD family hydrolase [Actinomycetes bacterium]